MPDQDKPSVYETLSKVNVNEHTEAKNGLTYLSWAWAWAELLKHYPDSTYTIYEYINESRGLYSNYFHDDKTAWVKTGVTVEGKELIEYLPVMNYKNESIPLENITSFDVNKAIQRSLTKAIARHGLGLYIYAGEDLPDGEESSESTSQPKPAKAKPQAASSPAPKNTGKWQDRVLKVGKNKGKSLQQILDEGLSEQLEGTLKWLENNYDPNSKYAADNLACIEDCKMALESNKQDKAVESDIPQATPDSQDQEEDDVPF